MFKTKKPDPLSTIAPFEKGFVHILMIEGNPDEAVSVIYNYVGGVFSIEIVPIIQTDN